MKLIEKDNVKYIVFEKLENVDFIKHCFTTRIGGVSKDFLSQMNMSFSRECRENVTKNYEIICSKIGVDYKKAVMSKKQVHSTNIHKVLNCDCGKGIVFENDIEDTDGFVTDIPGIPIVTFHADCAPLYFVDTVKKVIGLSHAGWRGTVNGMAEKTILKMQSEYGSKACDIIAGIGPSICQHCFEVDKPVAYEFLEKLPFSEKYIYKKGEKWHIDIQGINAQIIMNLGVPEENIEVSNICTKCNTDLFYSHRAMGEKRGNMAAILSID